MSQKKSIGKNLIVILNVCNKRFVYTGINAEILKTLFYVENQWLTSVKLKKEEHYFDNTETIFIDVISESSLGLN